MVMLVRESQKRKAKLSMFVSGALPKLTEVRAVSPSKPCASIFLRAEPLLKVMLLNAVQPSKVYAATASSLLSLAKVTLVSFDEPTNAPCAIVETFLGIVSEVIEVYARAP